MDWWYFLVERHLDRMLAATEEPATTTSTPSRRCLARTPLTRSSSTAAGCSSGGRARRHSAPRWGETATRSSSPGGIVMDLLGRVATVKEQILTTFRHCGRTPTRRPARALRRPPDRSVRRWCVCPCKRVRGSGPARRPPRPDPRRRYLITGTTARRKRRAPIRRPL